MRKLVLLAAFALILIFACSSATAQSTTTVTLPAVADTYLSQNSPTNNYGSNSTLLIDGDDPGGTGRDKRTLVKFDLSQIPPGQLSRVPP